MRITVKPTRVTSPKGNLLFFKKSQNAPAKVKEGASNNRPRPYAPNVAADWDNLISEAASAVMAQGKPVSTCPVSHSAQLKNKDNPSIEAVRVVLFLGQSRPQA